MCLDIPPDTGKSGVQHGFISILIARTSYRLATAILSPKKLHPLQQSYRLVASSNAASPRPTEVYIFLHHFSLLFPNMDRFDWLFTMQ